MSTTCTHWIWQITGKYPSLGISDRLRVVSSPLKQSDISPPLVLVIGKSTEFPQFPKPRSRLNKISLNLYSNEENHILIASTPLRQVQQKKPSCCIPFRDIQLSSDDANNPVLSQLLYPFVDLYCFFSYTEKDLQNICYCIIMRACISISNTTVVKPKTIITFDGKHWNSQAAKEKAYSYFQMYIAELECSGLTLEMPDVTMISVDRPELDTLGSYFGREMRPLRRLKAKLSLLFSVAHFNSLFDRAVDKLTLYPQMPLDYINLARQDNPPPANLHQMLEEFLGYGDIYNIGSFHAKVISTSILMNAYAVDMHLFDPCLVFNTLYKNPILVAISEETHINPNEFIGAILGHLKDGFNMLKSGEPSSLIHRRTLAEFRDVWSNCYSKTTCLSCLMEEPSEIASCGHSFCAFCVEMHGKYTTRLDVLLDKCLLCDRVIQLKVRLIPPSGRLNLMSIGGGGQHMAVDIPIQEIFDHVMGTSVGSIIILALWKDGRSIEKCMEDFERFAKHGFRPRLRMSKIISILMADAIYPEKPFEEALQSVYGDVLIDGLPYPAEVGTKIAVVAATTDDPRICVFTTYNGRGGPRDGYFAVRNRPGIRVWEVARCSSAAPFYLPAKFLPGIGNLHDGAVLKNNPSLLLEAEFRKLKRYKNEEPDLIVDIGSGTVQANTKRKSFGKSITDSWLCRLVRAKVADMRSDYQWQHHLGSKNEDQTRRMYRLDLLTTKLPPLDDSGAIPSLVTKVLQDKQLNKDIKMLSDRLFATLFYFEISELPYKLGTKFVVTGNIYFKRFNEKVMNRFESCIVRSSGRRIKLQKGSGELNEIYYNINIRCGEEICLELFDSRTRKAYPISGMPTTLTHLVEVCGLKAYFGTKAHKRRAKSDIYNDPSKRRKLLSSA